MTERLKVVAIETDAKRRPPLDSLPICKTPNLCGIVLGGGDGERLRPLIHRLRGDSLPKQYVNFVGTRSMLEHTFHRAEKLISSDRIFAVINRDHLNFPEVQQQISRRPRAPLVVQPVNKEIGPGVLLALMHVYKRFPDSTVVMFPSDHFILEEDLFMSHVYQAYPAVECDGSRLVILGMAPHEADSEYGYIVPGEEIEDAGLGSARKIELFVEKPATEAAKKLIKSGALLNTLVIVARCKTLVDAVQCTMTELHRSFQHVLQAIGTPEEQRVLEQVYHKVRPVNLSRGVLELLPRVEQRQAFLVLPVRGVYWSDCGSECRLRETFKKLGYPEQLLAPLSGVRLRDSSEGANVM
jgi:mannose-1-phosphate guanylyltransferase